jgi:hypothetical protein
MMPFILTVYRGSSELCAFYWYGIALKRLG